MWVDPLTDGKWLVVDSPFDELVTLAREAPGSAAVRGVLTILATLAFEGDADAALALGWIACTELGLPGGEFVGLDAAPESVRSAGIPPLIKLLVLSYAPTSFLADPAYLAKLERDSEAKEVYGRLQELVRRSAPSQNLALTALIVAQFARRIAFEIEVFEAAISGSARRRVLREITSKAKIVPGDSVDTSFSIGRDFVLERASFDTFSFAIQHEFGHHVTNHFVSGERDKLDAAQLRALADAVQRLLPEASRLTGQPVAPGDSRMARLPSGLQVMCTVDTLQSGPCTHVSMSQVGGPIDRDHAVTYIYVVAEVLRVSTDSVVVAYSPSGICHLASKGVLRPPRAWLRRGPDPSGLPERAEAWFAELARTGRVGRDEQDLTHILEDGGRRVDFYPAAPDAMSDLWLCAQLREGKQVGADRAARLRSAVAAGDPVALRLAIGNARTAGYATPGTVGLARLGESHCIIKDDDVIHTGCSAADLRDVLTQLHDAGFDIDEPVTATGSTLLFDAAVRDAELTAFLIATGADVSRRDNQGATALTEAARCGNWQAVTVLLNAGARADDRDGQGSTALHHAGRSGSTETVARLIAGGANVASTDERGATPLGYVRATTMVNLLCQAGANPNAADSIGSTPLMTAASRGDADVIGVLLQHGADPHAVTDAGESALHYAAVAANHRVAAVTKLLDAGADPEEETDEGVTALMAAAMHVHVDAVEVLLERGADPNARTVHGLTALMQAADGRDEGARDFKRKEESMACIQLLFAAGADIDVGDDRGWTALHYACLGFEAGPVEQLLRLGADPNVRAVDGATPLGLALAKTHSEMIDHLTAAGARKEVT